MNKSFSNKVRIDKNLQIWQLVNHSFDFLCLPVDANVFYLGKCRVSQVHGNSSITQRVLLCARFICTVCTRRIWWSCEGLTSISQQVLWIQLNNLLRKTMYNLYNYYGLPTTLQLWAAHKPMFTGRCLAANWPQVLYCTCLERYTFGTFHMSVSFTKETCMSLNASRLSAADYRWEYKSVIATKNVL